MNDYPEDKALLARKAQKAAHEVASKQVLNVDKRADEDEDVVVPIGRKRSRDPKLLDTVMKVMAPNSKFLQKIRTLQK